MVDKSRYNCVLSQEFSPCGNFLVCGNNFGDIVVYNLGEILNRSENQPNKSPNFSFSSPNHEQICSMTSTSQFLITGTIGVIYGWDWESIKESSPHLAWKINLTKPENRVDQDVNSLFINKEDNVEYLYAGCGDHVVHVHSLEDGKFVRCFEGHSDYIHSISHFDGQMASGGEDGCVRLWDLRQRSMVAVLEPATEPKLVRSHLGKWIGDVDLNATSLVCGGGCRAGLWDLRTLELMTAFDKTEDAGIHITKLLEDSLLLGGNQDYFYRLDTNGEELSKIESSSSTVYSALYRREPNQVLLLGGSSQYIDLCTDFTQRYQVLSFFKEEF